MDEISVTPQGGGGFTVEVRQGGRATSHRVSVPAGMLDRMGLAGADEAAVVRESFAFLLEREPNTSILPEFELGVISRYFPEYERELPGRMS
jgi:hypothetical protein